MHLPKGVVNLSDDTIIEDDDIIEEENDTQNSVKEEQSTPAGTEIIVFVNGESVPLSGKTEYIFVDIFDRITFDLQAGRGRAIATILNGRDAQFTEKLAHGDKIELYWKEN